jgi:hypothetical protein
MRLSRSPARTQAPFDDWDLVPHAGGGPAAGPGRAGRAGGPGPRACSGRGRGWGERGPEGGLPGRRADSIDDMDVLRHGAMGCLFDGIGAPAALGSFLRSFT